MAPVLSVCEWELAGICRICSGNEYHHIPADAALDSDLAHLDSALPLPGFRRRIHRPSHRCEPGHIYKI